jgi:hypothetical protein
VSDFFSKYVIILLFGLFVSIHSEAQVQLSPYIDAGENNVSDGLYVKTSVWGAYHWDKIKVIGI